MSACVCDYGDAPAVYHREERTARKPHRCYECQGTIQPGERYERTAALYDAWTAACTCSRCLDLRRYVEAHAPCFCWLHGSLHDDARDTLREYAHESAGFWIGGMKRLLRAERGAALAATKGEK